MLKRLTQPGDLLLSKMQVFLDGSSGADDVDEDLIKAFYQHLEMQRFSALVGQRLEVRSPSEANTASCNKKPEYIFQLVPLQTEVGSVKVATTVVSVRLNGIKRYLLTNSCLRFTPIQFQQARETSGDFDVRVSQETGDKSVVFQIAERL